MHSLVHVATQIWAEEQDPIWPPRLIRRETMHQYLRRKQVAQDLRRVQVLPHLTTAQVLHLLIKIWPSKDDANRTLWQAFLPHVLKVLQETDQFTGEKGFLFSIKVGRCLLQDGQPKEAIRCFEKANKHLDYPLKSRSMYELALAYLRGGQAQKAVDKLELLRKQANYSLHSSAPSILNYDLDHLVVQHSLAVAYRTNQQSEKAIEMLEHVLQAKTLGESSISRSMLQDDLALAYLENQQFEKAVELLEHVVQAKTLDETSIDHFSLRFNLAVAY
jgi:tetratricopeptide (TPR) repeat protein